MGYEYRIDNENRQALVQIEKEIAEALGEKPDLDNRPHEMSCSMWGVAFLMRWGGCKVTPEIIDTAFAKIDEIPSKWRPVLREFLTNKYTFVAWRGGP